ncbi:Selenoprotein P, N-terminal domain-containing protein [Aphelenchoides fujianensis]|nr:Selenoprotein P, N-terminal domain-containing protein [Aphelenchoides fujianensis]
MQWKSAVVFFSLLSVVIAESTKRAEVCEDVGERIRGSTLLEDYRGKRVVLAFSSLHCLSCASRLLRLTEIQRHFAVDVVVITPPNESAVDVKRAARRYPALRFEVAPCAPCEFDELLDTMSSKIFVLDSCGRLLHRYHHSVHQFSQLKAAFPSNECGPSCTPFERRKRDPDSTLPPQIAAIAIPETPYDTRLQMLPAASGRAEDAVYTYKQIFQQTARPTAPPPRVPQPMVQVAYSGAQPAYPQQQARAQQVEAGHQQQAQSAAFQRPPAQAAAQVGTRVQGRYQKYEPEAADSRQSWQNTVRYTPPPPTRPPPSAASYGDRLAEQRRQLAMQREERNPHRTIRTLKSRRRPPTATSHRERPFRSPNPSSRIDNERTRCPHRISRPSSSDRRRLPPPTTRRPPKTTKQPLVYSNVNQRGGLSYGRRTYGGQRYESSYQQQQRRRNELAAQRQKAIQEQQKAELEQLQRQELQRQIAEQAARQAAAVAAAAQQKEAAKVEAAPLYPDGEETVDTADYYEDIEEWTTAIPQVRLESPVSPEPLPDNPAEHPEFLFDLPCNGFTDEICYQQQTQLKPEEVHKCCQTKIVFTDQCVPGRCSNVTHQLCCIQKLLQSKFKCCNDKTQAEVLFPSDTFSRCCYESFVVEDDPCCPSGYSAEHWNHIYELCLPAVSFDLSQVRVPQKVVAGLSTTVNFDFSKTDKWRFTCKYGMHIPQYSYFPPASEKANTPTLGENDRF